MGGNSTGITITQHLLEQQRQSPEATGSFTTLLNELIVAAKVISREVNKAGLADILGATGKVNVQNEQVQKLDVFANNMVIERMQHIGQLCCMGSEENADLIDIPSQYPKGNYIIVFDPLDGSSNIDVNVSIGTIFGIYKKKSDETDVDCLLNDVLQPGIEQVAAGYFIYGSSTMMVYTTGNGTGVHGFTLYPSIGEFLLSHKDIKIPKKSKTYSVNEGNYAYWDENTRALIDHFKSVDREDNRPYSARCGEPGRRFSSKPAERGHFHVSGRPERPQETDWKTAVDGGGQPPCPRGKRGRRIRQRRPRPDPRNRPQRAPSAGAAVYRQQGRC